MVETACWPAVARALGRGINAQPGRLRCTASETKYAMRSLTTEAWSAPARTQEPLLEVRCLICSYPGASAGRPAGLRDCLALL